MTSVVWLYLDRVNVFFFFKFSTYFTSTVLPHIGFQWFLVHSSNPDSRGQCSVTVFRQSKCALFAPTSIFSVLVKRLKRFLSTQLSMFLVALVENTNSMTKSFVFIKFLKSQQYGTFDNWIAMKANSDKKKCPLKPWLWSYLLSQLRHFSPLTLVSED